MIYNKVVEGTFIERPNRFIAHVLINNKVEICHVKNTGKCKELLVKGCKVYLEESDNINRKTKYSLIAVMKDNLLINMDSQAPNKVIYEYLKTGKLVDNITLIKPEYTYDKSRFDFYVETKDKKIFIEVKGVTLESEGIVRFPDAKTERGVKHVKELIKAKSEGFETYIVFVVQMNSAIRFEPNVEMHKEFGDALALAKEAGVNILAYTCEVSPNTLQIKNELIVKI